MKDLNEKELMVIDGGTTCPSYCSADNYEAQVCNGALLIGIFKGFFGL
ncbi:hypothetical protein [Labilibaculum filiforme]|nr:hypothetical protein [Labilibaculum filiforme]